MKKILSKITAISLLLTSAFSAMPVSAGGVVVSLSVQSSSTSPQAENITWTGSGIYAANTAIVVTVSPIMTDVTSTSMSFDLDGDATVDTDYVTSSCMVANNSCTLTLNVATATTLTANTLPATFTFSATAQNYSVAILTSNPVDFGAVLFYANGGNDVYVTATVPATLAFDIRLSDDTANTNVCQLGSLDPASVNTCSYRLKISTNAASGFMTTIQADHDLGTGSATMTNITNDAAFAAGTEAYGIQILTGATAGGRNTGTGAMDQPIIEVVGGASTFSIDTSPVPTSTAENFVSYTGQFYGGAVPSLTNTTLVTHAAAINYATPAGFYSQTVTYLVTATY